MSNAPTWVMMIPVISTAHLPESDTLEQTEQLCAVYAGGGFLRIRPDVNPIDWAYPIKLWLDSHFSDANWVRFDCDADIVDGLPTYDWTKP